MDSTTISMDTYEKIPWKKEKPIIGGLTHFIEKIGADKINPIILKNYTDTLAKFVELGYEVKQVDMNSTHLGYALAIYYIIMPAEASTNLARFDGVKYGLHVDGGKSSIDDYFATRAAGFGPEVRRRILLGTYVLSSGYYDAYYNRANALRRLIMEDFNKAFKLVDLILTPTTPSVAFKIGEKSDDPVAMYLEDIFTVTANLTGMPAISVPTGFAEVAGKELPIGMQLSARHGDEDSLFSVGKDIEIGV